MPSFSKSSQEKLDSCDYELKILFERVVQGFDCKVISGYRGEEEQNEAYRNNHSTKQFPDSKHNWKPSRAVDVLPYPIDWQDLNRMYVFGGYVKGIAAEMGIKIRWGGDWNGDTQVNDQKFIDLPHFELNSGGKQQWES